MAGAKVTATVRSKNPLKGAVEIIPERCYYAALKSPPPSHNILASLPKRNNSRKDNAAAASADQQQSQSKHPTPTSEKKQVHFFNIDNELVYWNFFLDFGPLNLGQLVRFCNKLNEKLKRFPVVCFYSNTVPAKRANAIFLICAWQMLYLDRSPEQAYAGFDQTSIQEQQQNEPDNDNVDSNNKSATDESNVSSSCSLPPVSATQGAVTVEPCPPFHDASPCECNYDLTIRDCLDGLAKARYHRFFDLDTFDLEEYEYFEQVENGDLNWIVQNKILAFAGPSYERHISPEGYCTLSPNDYIPYFLKKNVSLVVRLNKKAYDEEDFVKAGINHVEAFFLDGSCPPMRILHGVIEAFEEVGENQAFAVHCKAGLGRTGTCIGAYLMKHFRLTAAEVIGWMRICRPGCVIGPQQNFLKKIQPLMWQEGVMAGYIEAPPIFMDDKQANNKKKSSSSGAVASASVSSNKKTKEQQGGLSTDSDAVSGRAGQGDALRASRIKRPTVGSGTAANAGNNVNNTTGTAAMTTPKSGVKAPMMGVPITPSSAQTNCSTSSEGSYPGTPKPASPPATPEASSKACLVKHHTENNNVQQQAATTATTQLWCG